MPDSSQTKTRKRKQPPRGYGRSSPGEDSNKSTNETGEDSSSEKKISGKNPTTSAEDHDDAMGSNWDDSAHRQFVMAIFEVGLSQASPSVIMEHMELLGGKQQAATDLTLSSLDAVTSERIKSHLQKFRKNGKKSRVEFCAEYDRWLEFATEAVAPVGVATAHQDDYVHVCEKMIKNSALHKEGVLLGGDLAAFLSFMDRREEEFTRHHKTFGSQEMHTCSQQARQRAGFSVKKRLKSRADSFPSMREYSQLLSNGASLAMPKLTAQEKASHLGKSFDHVGTLFQTLSRHVMAGRAVESFMPVDTALPVGENGAAHQLANATVESSWLRTGVTADIDAVSGPEFP